MCEPYCSSGLSEEQWGGFPAVWVPPGWGPCTVWLAAPKSPDLLMAWKPDFLLAGKENINSEEHERQIVKQGCYLTRQQLLGGCKQGLNHSRGQQICHNLSRETLSSDEGLGLPVTIWLLQQQKLLQNTAGVLCTYLIECALQLLERITENRRCYLNTSCSTFF